MDLKRSPKVAVQSNGYLLDNSDNKTVQIDYLVLNLKGSPLLADKKIDYVPAEYGTKIFSQRGEVTYNKRTIGNLVFAPRSTALNKDLVQLKLDNSLFYTLPMAELEKVVKTVIRGLNLKFSGINRLDIAMDYVDNSDKTENLIQSLLLRKTLLSGRKKAITPYYHTEKGNLTFEGVRIGSRTSTRHLRIYNKTLEQQSNPKTYILDRWKKSNMVGKIWRYEYQLNNTFLRDKDNVNLDTIFNENFIFSMLTTASDNHFGFKENTGKSEVNKEKDIIFFDWEKIRKELSLLTVVIKKIKRNIIETMIGQKRIVKAMLRSYFSTYQNEIYIQPVWNILTDYGLKDWLRTKLPDYLKEFERKQILKTFNENKLDKDLPLWN